MPDQSLNGIDLKLQGFVSFVYIFSRPLCEEAMIDGLKKALHKYPYLSGRIKNLQTNKPVKSACDSGVLLSVERYNEGIPEKLHDNAELIARSCINPDSALEPDDIPVMQIKICHYKNASTLGISYDHAVCDGWSIYNFVNDWGKLSRGLDREIEDWEMDRNTYGEMSLGDGSIESTHIPIVQSSRQLSQPKDEPCQAKTFRFSKADIDKLVANAVNKGVDNVRELKYGLIPAVIWKTIASNASNMGDYLSFTQVYDSRSLLGMGKHYFGNALVFSFLEKEKQLFFDMSVEEIGSEILSMRNELQEHSDDIRVEIAYWKRLIEKNKVGEYQYGAIERYIQGQVYFNNMTKQPIYDVDFGEGPPIWFDYPGRTNWARHISALPAPEGNGDIIILVTLPEDEMARFSQQYCAALCWSSQHLQR